MSAKPELIADWWYCGDEVCCCSHPQIRRLVPPTRALAGGGLIYEGAGTGTVEEGPWASEPTVAELKEQWVWMLDAARRHNVDNLAEIEAEAKAILEGEV